MTVSAQSGTDWLHRLVARPLPTVLIFAGILIFGLAALVNLPIAALPDVDYPTIYVQAKLPGASAETMASTVAAPLESQLGSVPGIRLMSSTNQPGSTSIALQFEANRNLDDAALEVEKSLAEAASDLPRDLPHPPTYYKTGSTSYSVAVVALTSPAMPMPKLSRLAEEVVVRRLQAVPGVGRVSIADEQRPTVRVLADPAKLLARGLTLADVRDSIARATTIRPKGQLIGPDRTIELAANDQIQSAGDYGALVLAWHDGAPILLQDVATIEDGAESLNKAGWYNGTPAIVLDIARSPKANVVATVDGVKKALAELRGTLPDSVMLMLVSDRTTNTRAALHHLSITLAVTVFAVVAVIFLFVRRAAATVIPALAIPISLLATLIGMVLLGYTIDNLSLMALAISVGFVVDDAIVVVENVVRRLERGEPVLEATIAGTREVGFTILSITVSLVAVFIPVLLMAGVVGQFFREFGAVVSIAVIVSGLVSITLTPVLCAAMLRRHRSGGAPDRGRPDRLTRLYGRSLGWVLRHRAATMLAFLAVTGGTIWLYAYVPKGFLPRQDVGTMVGFIDAPAGTSAEAMKSHITALIALVQQDPAVATVTAYLNGDNAGSMYVNLKDRSERDGVDAVIGRLRKTTLTVHGAQLYLQPRPELALGVDSPPTEYQYMLSDADDAEVRQWAPRFEAALKALPFMRDVRSDIRAGAPELTVDIDRAVAARYGIDAAGIDDALYDAFGERRVAEIFDDATQRYVLLQYDRASSLDEGALAYTRVRSASGAMVPLTAIAHFRRTQTPSVIRHKGRLPVATINFNLASGTSLGVAVEAVHGIERDLAMPAGLHGSFDGTADEFERSLTAEPWLVMAALVIVYIVLGILYESALHPLTILSSLPSAGAGALLAALLLHQEFTLISLIGVLLLIGIVKKNAIMIVDFALDAQRHRGLTPRDAIFQASVQRFRPIMMTTLAALMGALPLAFEQGAGAELRNPLGVAIIGGLLISQMLTLYTTPVIYLALDGVARRFRSQRTSVNVMAAGE
jgi:hydrophobe/amphiphile efflux-1 (HAE1) family protein